MFFIIFITLSGNLQDLKASLHLWSWSLRSDGSHHGLKRINLLERAIAAAWHEQVQLNLEHIPLVTFGDCDTCVIPFQ